MSTYRINSSGLDSIPEVLEPTNHSISCRSTKTSRLREKSCQRKLKLIDSKKLSEPPSFKKIKKTKKKSAELGPHIPAPVTKVDENSIAPQQLGQGDCDVATDRHEEAEITAETQNEIESELTKEDEKVRIHFNDEDSVSKFSQSQASQVQELKAHGGLIIRCMRRISKLQKANSIDLLAIEHLETQIVKTKAQCAYRLENELHKFEKVDSVCKNLARTSADLDKRNKSLQGQIKKVENEISYKEEEFNMKKKHLTDEIKSAAVNMAKLYEVTSDVYKNIDELASRLVNLLELKINRY